MAHIFTRGPAPAVPEHWPTAPHPHVLDDFAAPTPLVALDLSTVEDGYRTLLKAIPGFLVHRAVKCNPAAAILARPVGLECGFEVAPHGELDSLRTKGIDATGVPFSDPVKSSGQIVAAREAGLWRFAFDSEAELHKLAGYTLGAPVYARVRLDDDSGFRQSRTFGAEADTACSLMLLARGLGLQPYGRTFHAGSQCTSPAVWRSGIAAVGRLRERLEHDDIQVTVVDLDRGLPAPYLEPVPPIADFGRAICADVVDLLPYEPEPLAVEPGPYLVAESGTIASIIIGREERRGVDWLDLDVGVYNGLMENQQLQNWAYPLSSSRWAHTGVPTANFTVADPSCDSAETLFIGSRCPPPSPSTTDVTSAPPAHTRSATHPTSTASRRRNRWSWPPRT